jgi:hypothetical protein
MFIEVNVMGIEYINQFLAKKCVITRSQLCFNKITAFSH